MKEISKKKEKLEDTRQIARLSCCQRWQVNNEVDCAQNYEGRMARTMEKCTLDLQIIFQWMFI